MKRFKLLKSVGKSYEEQGAVYFTCRTYEAQPAAVKKKIDQLCARVGGDYAPALHAFLTTDADWVLTCDRYHISPATLERLRRRFYEAW